MKRRDFITLLGGAAAWPLAARAQQGERVRRIGVLMGFANDVEAKARIEAFEKGLETEGWSPGQNLRIEYRYAEGDPRACRRSRKNWWSSSRTAFSARAPRS